MFKDFSFLESLKTDSFNGIDINCFLNNDVSSPESFGIKEEEDDEDILKDLSPLMKKHEEMIFKENIKAEKNLDFIDDFIKTIDKTNIENSEDNKKRKRNIKKDEIIDETCLSEKDAKRQQRLIKNRESAQASRERKKSYVKGLEDNVKTLSSTNSNLTSKVVTLEEENQLLRQQLERAIKGEKLDNIKIEKRKTTNISQKQAITKKLPLPPIQQMPFLTSQYWTGLFNGGNNPMNNTNNNNTNNNINTSPKVVLFIALFCVALFLVRPGSNFAEQKIDTKNMGRVIQSIKESNLENTASEVEQLYVTLENLEKKDISSKLNEVIGKINLKFDNKSENVTFVFDKTNDGKENEITLSKNLLFEICSKLNPKEEIDLKN